MNKRPGCAGQKKRGSGRKRNMLYMKNRFSSLAKSLEQQGGITGRCLAAAKLHLAAGEVIVLNIYDYKSLHVRCLMRICRPKG